MSSLSSCHDHEELPVDLLMTFISNACHEDTVEELNLTKCCIIYVASDCSFSHYSKVTVRFSVMCSHPCLGAWLVS